METPPGETTEAGNPLIRDGLDQINDPSRPADDGKIQLLPFIVDDPTRSADYGEPRLMPDILVNPTPAASGRSSPPQPIRGDQPFVMPAGTVPDKSEQESVPDDDEDPSSGELEITPAGSDGFTPPAADSIGVDTPLVSERHRYRLPSMTNRPIPTPSRARHQTIRSKSLARASFSFPPSARWG